MPNAHTRTSNIELTEVERAQLVSMARSRSLPAALALRARIVLACEGSMSSPVGPLNTRLKLVNSNFVQAGRNVSSRRPQSDRPQTDV